MTKKNNEEEVTLIGYARVSTDDQSVDLQVELLEAAGVRKENIYSENISGAKTNKPELTRALRALQEGDTLVVWKFDRLARSMVNLMEITKELDDKKCKFVSLTEGVDTSTTVGRCFMMMSGVFAQFERDLIAERTQAGVDRALANGVKFGPDFKLRPEDVPKLWKEVNEQGMPKVKAAKKYGVHVQTITRRLKDYEESKKKPTRKKH